MQLPEYHLIVQLAGGFSLAANNGGGYNLVFDGSGAFEPDNGGSPVPPPISPSFVPPLSVLQSPAMPFASLLSPYVPETALWALSYGGEFNRTLSSANLPANASALLNTSNSMWFFLVPSISSYPNLAVSIDTWMYNLSSVSVNSSGSFGTLWIGTSWNFKNATYSLPAAFQLVVQLSTQVDISVSVSGTHLVLQPTIDRLQSTVSLLSTQIGSINIAFFNAAIAKLIPTLNLSLKPFNLPIPADFAIVSPSITYDVGYANLGASLSFTGSVPGVTCGTGECAVQNTCCSSSCCPLPQASCCSNGDCCPQGTVCQNDQCYTSDGSALYNRTIALKNKRLLQ